MGTRLIEGRLFEDADNALDRTGIIIDRVLARKMFEGRSPLNQQILVRFRGPEPELLTVIGVVEHQRSTRLASDGRETVYVTDGFFQHGAATNGWVIRTSGDPLALAPTRFALTMIGIFSIVAALLAAVGLYGVLATAVRQRTAEIGIRMTFGAPTSGIFKLIIGQGLRLSVLGIVIGVGAAWALTRVITSLLVDVRPTEPVTFATIAVTFLAIAALASWLPARRAARLDPMVALRDE